MSLGFKQSEFKNQFHFDKRKSIRKCLKNKNSKMIRNCDKLQPKWQVQETLPGDNRLFVFIHYYIIWSFILKILILNWIFVSFSKKLPFQGFAQFLLD